MKSLLLDPSFCISFLIYWNIICIIRANKQKINDIYISIFILTIYCVSYQIGTVVWHFDGSIDKVGEDTNTLWQIIDILGFFGIYAGTLALKRCLVIINFYGDKYEFYNKRLEKTDLK